MTATALVATYLIKTSPAGAGPDLYLINKYGGYSGPSPQARGRPDPHRRGEEDDGTIPAGAGPTE